MGRRFRIGPGALLLQIFLAASAYAETGRPPNVILIVSDDAGYADFSFQGARDVHTPRIDSIAAGGVRCTSGYVSSSVCSPSRAGLMTGRYQQRFGHEFNIPARFSEANGLPVDEITLPVVLRGAGYRTVALGKWHLGYARHFQPLQRGFSDFYGFLQGARGYWPMQGTTLNRLLVDEAPATERFAYMTTHLGDEAARFITQHDWRPFFLYLSFNAVHTPMHAEEAVLAQVDEDLPPKRRKLLAMTISMDRAVGTVLDALESRGLTQDTLVIFVNDNGGATNNASVNFPLRGTKGTPFEGGLRVPFLVRWPSVLPAGVDYDRPVSTLDLFPTAMAAAGIEGPPPKALDGVNLLPFLTGERQGDPHTRLLWRRGEDMAVRSGDWKLLRRGDSPPMLFDLDADVGETTDLAPDRPELVAELSAAYEAWQRGLAEPRWTYGRPK